MAGCSRQPAWVERWTHVKGRLLSLYDQLLPYALPLAVGGVFLGLLGALLSYPATYLVISRYRARASRPVADNEPLPPRTA